MELASYLAGERWSDHPACTHPLLATLARLVNDSTSDAGRGRLLPLVPSVIGLTTGDPRVDVDISLRCASTALPVASAERQRVLAVGVLATERALARLDGRPATSPSERGRTALAQAPDAARWAQRFCGQIESAPDAFPRRSAPTIVSVSVLGIAQACVPDPDAMLYDLFAAVIEDCATTIGRGRHPAATPMDLSSSTVVG